MRSLHAEGAQSILSLRMNQCCCPREHPRESPAGFQGLGPLQAIPGPRSRWPVCPLLSASVVPVRPSCLQSVMGRPPGPRSLPGDLIQHHGSTHHLYTHDPQLPSPAQLSPELQTPASSCFLPISTSVSNRTLRLKTRPLKFPPKPALCLPVAFNGKYFPRRLNTTFGDFLDADLSHTHIQSISVSCRLCLPHQPRDGHCSPLPPAPLPPLSKAPPPTAWWLPNWSLCLPRPVLSWQPSDSSVN